MMDTIYCADEVQYDREVSSMCPTVVRLICKAIRALWKRRLRFYQTMAMPCKTIQIEKTIDDGEKSEGELTVKLQHIHLKL